MKHRCVFLTGCMMLIMLSFNGCRRDEDTKEKNEAVVNPDYEMNPPIAQQVSIQLLEDNEAGNLLLVADFGPQVIKGPYHAIQLSTGKVVLQDDGKGGDEKAGDNKFSIILKEDISSLTKELEELQSRTREFTKEPAFEFVGRHKVKLDAKGLRQFDFPDFKGGRRVPVPTKPFCFLRLNVSIPHSLFVTNVKTVEDSSRIVHPCNGNGTANGAWTFQRLISDMANTPVTSVSPEDFVKDWLNTWLDTTIVNEEQILARKRMFDEVIKPWVIRSGSPASTFTENTWRTRPLKLELAPFKLIAIVNRLDLHGNTGYGVSNAGEGRFVFEVLSNNCTPIAGQFNVIFEYGVPIHKCAELNNYAQKWYDLKDIPDGLGSAAYNNALQAITDVFAKANAEPAKPNGSAINQIRTNERAIGAPWELREFNVDAGTHKLVLTTVKQEPIEKYNESSPLASAADVARLVTWINDNAPDILANKHSVPLTITDAGSTVALLGGRAHSEPGIWTGTGILDAEARHHFSFNTCSGCHQQETNTPFVHLTSVPFTQESVPSGFLTGNVVADPAGSGVNHSFGDLEDRRRKLADLLCTSCKGNFTEVVSVLTFVPNKMPH